MVTYYWRLLGQIEFELHRVILICSRLGKIVKENFIHVLYQTNILIISRHFIGLVTEEGLQGNLWNMESLHNSVFVEMVRNLLLKLQVVTGLFVSDLVRTSRKTKKMRIGSFSHVSNLLFSGVSYKTRFPECVKPGELESHS